MELSDKRIKLCSYQEKNGFKDLDSDGVVDSYLLDGRFIIGWHTVDKKKYYFKEPGIMYKNETKIISDIEYVFDSEGVCISKNC